MAPVLTIGDSTRSIDEFIDLLSEAGVRLVVYYLIAAGGDHLAFLGR
jgi:hypothetical protein